MDPARSPHATAPVRGVIARCMLSCLLALSAFTPAAAQSTSTTLLEDLTWTELRDQIRAGKTTVLIPIGGTEQSGPHLALGKHNVRVKVLAQRIAGELGNAMVAPVVAYVPEGGINPPTSHMKFAGTISIPDDVFEKTLESIAGSLRVHGFINVVFIGDHGGYQASLAKVAARLDKTWAGSAHALAPPEYYKASGQGFDQLLLARGFRKDEIGTHAALADTALQLAVAPETVRSELLKTPAPAAFGPALGVYGGNPSRATAELGQLGVDLIVRQTVAAIRAGAAGK
jgi:creatinine amidohydrolase/Fe(II)-dependent formamide hydrolase-like protein